MRTIENSKRLMLKNILVTTDFSQTSKTSVRYAAAFAEQFDASLCLAHVLPPEPIPPQTLEPFPVDADPRRRMADRNLMELMQEIPVKTGRCETVVRRGEFWTVVSDLINDHKVDLVVTGTHGRRGLGRIVLGSAAEQIYRRAACPVLTVGPLARPLPATGWNPKTIVFPTDGSATSIQALPYALSLAEENQATLIYLQLMPFVRPEDRDQEAGIGRKELRALLPEGAEEWCSPEFVVGFESPAEGILRAANERGADLIVMGVRGTVDASFADHLAWPTASHVAAEAPCPVLTVRG